MELDDFKKNWDDLNTKLDDIQAMQRSMQRTIEGKRTKAATNRLKREPIVELVLSGLALLWTGSFLADNFDRVLRAPLNAIPAALVYAFAIFTIWLSVRQLMMIARLDYSDAVVETQKKLAYLRTLRVRSTQFMMLIGLPLWIIFPLVAGQALFGYEFIQSVNQAWLWSNVAFGVVVSGIIVALARKFGQRSSFLRRVNNLLAGSEISQAEALLRDLHRFEGS